MAKKIKTIKYGIIHYHAGCNQCDFVSGMQTQGCQKAKDVRAEVYKHVRATGHECWIECGTHTRYALVDGARHNKACTRLETGVANADSESNPAVSSG